MRDTSERVAGTAKGNHQLRRRRTEEGGTRHGKLVPARNAVVGYIHTAVWPLMCRSSSSFRPSCPIVITRSIGT